MARQGELPWIAELLGQGLRQLGLTAARERQFPVDQVCSRTLLRWNKSINLVASKTGTRELVEKHFLDSLTLLPVIDPVLDEGAALTGYRHRRRVPRPGAGCGPGRSS